MTDASILLQSLALADPGSLLIPLITAGATVAATALNRPPKPKGPTRMPDPQSPEVLEARRRRIAETQATSGRESTILSDDTFSNNLLGE
jgi:hypothetical protein